MKNPNSKGGAPVKLAVVLIVLIVAAGVVVALQPWNLFNSGSGPVRFYSRAYFYLIGTEDNGPLENVALYFPDPNVGDNKILNRDYIKDGYWTLYAQTDNGLVTEIQALTVVQLVAPRTSELVISSMGANTSVWGPKYSFTEINRLYPGEILEIQLWWEIPSSMMNQLTLQDTGPYSPAVLIYPNPAKNIDGSFFAGLYRIDENYVVQEVVEEFQENDYNAPTQLWWELASI